MKIVHFSTNDITGGAARAGYRLHKGLRSLNLDSSMVVINRKSNDPNIMRFNASRHLTDRIQRFMRRQKIRRDFSSYEATRPKGYERFTDDRTQYAGYVRSYTDKVDIVNLHWIADFIDLPEFLEYVSSPIVWTLHDMNALTGGCHYDAGCDRYMRGCGACPQLRSTSEKDLSHRIWLRKLETFRKLDKNKFRIAAPSHWLGGLAASSSLLDGLEISVIPYGIDTSVFRPIDYRAARQALDIPNDCRVILFVADSVNNRRKGFSLLCDALDHADLTSNTYLLSIGNGNPEVPTTMPHRHLGRIEQNWMLAMIYSAADVFVISSLQDNLPNTVLESLACGTPVVGFSVGGIPDMVRPDITGYLAAAGDVRALRAAIIRLLKDDNIRTEMGIACREIATNEYALQLQASRYVEVYEKMIEGSLTQLRRHDAVS